MPSSASPTRETCSSEMLWVWVSWLDRTVSLLFSGAADAWRDVWSEGKAVLQGMGAEMSRDFFFLDLVLREEIEGELIWLVAERWV